MSICLTLGTPEKIMIQRVIEYLRDLVVFSRVFIQIFAWKYRMEHLYKVKLVATCLWKLKCIILTCEHLRQHVEKA